METFEFQIVAKNPKIVTEAPDWTGLPISLTELFLERLPLPDYVRFGSVCPKWLAVQKEHRLRHAPIPPPMRRPHFIWLVPYFHCFDKKSIDCFSLTDSKIYHVTRPNAAFTFQFLASCHGWLLMLSKHGLNPPFQVSLFNPVTGFQLGQFQLPPITTSVGGKSFGALSGPPTFLDCIALIVDDVCCDFYLCMVHGKQSEWALVSLPEEENLLDYQNKWLGAVYHVGKFYCFTRKDFETVVVIDADSSIPSARVVDMDFDGWNAEHYDTIVDADSHLAEFDNELFLVLQPKNMKVQILKADFYRMRWVEIKGGIGDRVIFVGYGGSMCMLASDVCGFNGNCIYDFNRLQVFKCDTMQWMDDPIFSLQEVRNFTRQNCRWLLPSLDYVGRA